MKKRISIFTPSLQIGGVEKVFITYAQGLLDMGYDITYVMCRTNNIFESILPSGIKTFLLGNKDIRLRYSIFRIIKYLINEKPDIFITGGDIPNVMAIIANMFAKNKTKIIISHHNYLNIERNSLLSKILIKYIYNYASKIIAVSDGIYRMLLELKVNKNNLITIYNPIEVEKVIILGNSDKNITYPATYILFVGRIGVIKNISLLIESFKILTGQFPNIELIILGDGPLKEPLKSKINKDSDLSTKIHFLDADANPYPIIKNASLIVLPSFSEALPTVIIESFVFGKTVVSTPTLGARDLLENGRLGYISESFNDSNEFSNKMATGLMYPIDNSVLRQKSYHYDLRYKKKELEELINSL